jgi:hypothetical protein
MKVDLVKLGGFFMKRKYPLFLQAMGSSLDKTPVKVLARNTEYESVLTGPYGMMRLNQLGLISKGIAFINPFVQTKAHSSDHDIYPAPGEVTQDPIKLWWSSEYYSYGYPMTMEWAKRFSDSVVRYIETEGPLGILLDDWWLNHRWWDMSEADYQLMHPPNLAEILGYIEGEISAALWGRPQGGILIVNGGYTHRSTTYRFWEGVGRSYNPWRRVIENALPGDYIQVNNPTPWNKFMAGFMMGKKRRNPICITVPDGKKIADSHTLNVPTPAKYPWR